MTRGEIELASIRGYNARIKALIKELAILREQIVTISPAPLSERVSGSKAHDLGDVVAGFMDKSDKISRKIVDDMQARQNIIDRILSLENPLFSSILYWHFASDLNHSEKAAKMNCSLSRVKHAYRPAVRAYDDKYFHGK